MIVISKKIPNWMTNSKKLLEQKNNNANPHYIKKSKNFK